MGSVGQRKCVLPEGFTFTRAGGGCDHVQRIGAHVGHSIGQSTCTQITGNGPRAAEGRLEIAIGDKIVSRSGNPADYERQIIDKNIPGIR